MLNNILKLLDSVNSSWEDIKNEIDILPVNYKDPRGLTLIGWLIKLEFITCDIRERTLVYLLEKGYDIDNIDNNHETPLIYSCKSNKEDVAKLLIDNKANINIYDDFNDSPLMWSAYKGNLSLVKYLVENGADVNHKYRDGKNALMWACKRNHTEIVQYLLNFTIDISMVDNRDENLLQLTQNEELKNIIREWLIQNKLCFIKSFRDMFSENLLYERQLTKKIFDYYFLENRPNPFKL